MIKLDIAKYCSNCPEFEANVEKLECDMYGLCDTIITCEHSKRCDAIRKHLLQNFDIQ